MSPRLKKDTTANNHRKNHHPGVVWYDVDDEPLKTLLRDLATSITASIPEAQLDVPKSEFAFFCFENGEAMFWTSTTDHAELVKVLRRFLAEING